MDSLRNQIVERKVIALIAENAKIEETDFEPSQDEEVAIPHQVSGQEESEIPEAKQGGEAEDLPTAADRT
jgi:hypothetical protein